MAQIIPPPLAVDGVTLVQSPAGIISVGTVGAAQLGANAVAPSNMTAAAKKRFAGLNGDRTSTATESVSTSFYGGRTGTSLGSSARTPVSKAITLKELSVYVPLSVPLITNSVTVTLYKGTGAGAAAATALTITYDSTSTPGATLTAVADVALAVGDFVYWQVDFVGLNGTGKTFSAECEWWPA